MNNDKRKSLITNLLAGIAFPILLVAVFLGSAVDEMRFSTALKLYPGTTVGAISLGVLGLALFITSCLLIKRWGIPWFDYQRGGVKDYLEVRSPFRTYDELAAHFFEASQLLYDNQDRLGDSVGYAATMFSMETPGVEFNCFVIMHAESTNNKMVDECLEKAGDAIEARQNFFSKGLNTNMLFLLCAENYNEAFDDFVQDVEESFFFSFCPVGVCLETRILKMPWRLKGLSNRKLRKWFLEMLNSGRSESEMIKTPLKK
jgi:hypothetical protein